MAETLEAGVSGLTERVIEETGYGSDSEFIDNFTNTAKIITDKLLALSKITDQQTSDEKSDGIDIYRSWVKLTYDMGRQQKMLLAAIKADKVLAEKLRASDLMKGMEEEVEAYRKRKGL